MTRPTAAILIIGNEILSGKTQDANTSWIALRLAARGILLRETRTVRDEEDAIVSAVRALKSGHTYVFTTGGIGPTHDDITADSMAKAFNTPLEINAEARKKLEDYYRDSGTDLNDARLRMARVPKGAALIPNPVSAAPGFRCENVYVMAGVPKIMQAMFEEIEDTLEKGAPVLSRSVTAPLREGDIAFALEAIQKEFPDVEIGSYPGMAGGRVSLTLALRADNKARLEIATEKVGELVRRAGQEPVIS
jgi:molybdenum cofactor synthesis domain-containing protein